MKVVIEIDPKDLASGINQVVSSEETAIVELDDEMEDEMEMEDDDACPPATQDEELNAENREYAVEEYSYGMSVPGWEKKNAKCGICEYYNVKSFMRECIEEGLGLEGDVGYCERLAFVCSAENICNAYEPGGPIMDEYNEDEPIEGGSKDLF